MTLMIRRSFSLLAAAAFAALIVPSLPAAAQEDLYARMQRVNSGLTSYQADVTVAIQLHTFPYLSPTLEGKAYYKKPDKNAVQFQSVPALAGQLKKVVGQMEPPSDWPKLYEVTKTNDDGTNAMFKLVRKKNGRIDHVDVKVDDKTATVSEMTYVYKESEGGGSIKFTNTYDQIAGNYVVKQQTGKVDIPHYNADISSKFANYKLNVPIDEKVFTES
ncbi:MAG TPA: hypothetical protein VGX96_14765 [Candidatus Elarobacter sp.]|nr:hypothetical protein [Candidatus Elarobacter sp.]